MTDGENDPCVAIVSSAPLIARRVGMSSLALLTIVDRSCSTARSVLGGGYSGGPANQRWFRNSMNDCMLTFSLIDLEKLLTGEQNG